MTRDERPSTPEPGVDRREEAVTTGTALVLVERRDHRFRPDRAVIDLRDGAAGITVPSDVEVLLVRRWFLLAILGALQILDLLTTRMVIEAGGAEANPLMAPIIHHPVAPVAVKLGGLAVVAGVLRCCPPRSTIVDRAMITVTALYSAVVAWNLLNLLNAG